MVDGQQENAVSQQRWVVYSSVA